MFGMKQSVWTAVAKRLLWTLLILLTGLILTGTVSQAAKAQEEPNTITNPNDSPAEQPPDPDPYAILTTMIATLDELIASRPTPNQLSVLRQMRNWSDVALTKYTGLNSDVIGLTTALGKVAKNAEAYLRKAGSCSDEICMTIMEVREDSMLLSTHFAESWLIQARGIPGYNTRLLNRANIAYDKGLAFMNDDNYSKAIPEMVNTLNTLGKGWVFDVDLFEQNIRNTFTPEVVGFSYAINRNGLLVAADGVGMARTSADGVAVSQSETKEMNIASMTKTITAAQVLWFMQYSDVDVDDQIGPYMPWDWTLGNGVAELTFRHLLTHRSGINDNVDCATDLASLQNCFAADITLPGSPNAAYVGNVYTWNYNNANYAIFRVIYKFITGVCDGNDPCPPTTDANTSEVYRTSVQCSIFLLMGLSQPDFNPGCSGPDLMPLDASPTLFYGLPGEAVNGYADIDWTDIGGGGGWYLSAVEMAQFMAHLRYNKQVLKPATRLEMYSGFLGFSDPVAFAARAQGVYGIYRAHGGFLQYGPPFNGRANTQYHASCLYDFGSGIQAVIMVNGAQVTDRCIGLKNAFEASWVAK